MCKLYNVYYGGTLVYCIEATESIFVAVEFIESLVGEVDWRLISVDPEPIIV